MKVELGVPADPAASLPARGDPTWRIRFETNFVRHVLRLLGALVLGVSPVFLCAFHAASTAGMGLAALGFIPVGLGLLLLAVSEFGVGQTVVLYNGEVLRVRRALGRDLDVSVEGSRVALALTRRAHVGSAAAVGLVVSQAQGVKWLEFPGESEADARRVIAALLRTEGVAHLLEDEAVEVLRSCQFQIL